MRHLPLILPTERLLVRTLDVSYTPQVLTFLTRNREFHRAWDPLVDEDFFTALHTRNRLQYDEELLLAGSAVKFWVFAREDDQLRMVLGYIGISNIIRGAFQSCFLGYKRDHAVGGRGIMTEALQAVVQFAFKDLALHRLEANIIPRNLPSRRLVERLGFVCEGLSKRYLKINGVWEDHLHYVLLNPEEL